MVANMTDDDIWRLNRGGHDPHKVYAAYETRSNHKGQPTVILAKTVKGYGMGEAGEALNTTHQTKKMTRGVLALPRPLRDPVADDQLEEVPFFTPAEKLRGVEYLHERRAALGGFLPQRRRKAAAARGAEARSVQRACSRPPASARSPPPWPSCRC